MLQILTSEPGPTETHPGQGMSAEEWFRII